jgi:hypothetical protein
MNLSDVLGYTLEDGITMLKNNGIEAPQIKVTAPPREKSDYFDEHYRIIKVTAMQNNNVELLVCKPL